MKEKKNEIDIPLKISEDSQQIYATGAFGGFTPYDFRIILYNESLIPSDKEGEVEMVRDSEYQLVISPITAVQLRDWLSKQIKMYEEHVGKINNPLSKD